MSVDRGPELAARDRTCLVFNQLHDCPWLARPAVHPTNMPHYPVGEAAA